MPKPMPSYFISHGGGPWPWIPQMRQAFARLEDSYNRMHSELPEKPKAILMISGHWETEGFALMHSAHPPMVYDYSNFPPHTYDVVYPAPGDPALTERVAGMIGAAGLPVQLDDRQGFDHGTFVPMAILYPQAEVPLVQVSIGKTYDPAQHIALGRALAPLRDEGVLIIGSGLSYHNLRMFGPQAEVPSRAFDDWLHRALALPPTERTQALLDWETAPYARVCHAREDHLVPIFAALGAAEDAPATRVYHEHGIFGGVTASSYRFG